MVDGKRYWFRAKRYGWGWGLPLTWEGWVVLVVFLLLVSLGSVFVSPVRHPGLHIGYVAGLGVVLLIVCYAKGEPTKWRWGNERR